MVISGLISVREVTELSLVLLSSIKDDVECCDFEAGAVVFFLLPFEFFTNDEG